MLLIAIWILGGLLYWLKEVIDNGFQLGLIGDILVGIPLCLIFGPFWIISNFLNNLLDRR